LLGDVLVAVVVVVCLSSLLRGWGHDVAFFGNILFDLLYPAVY